MSIGKAVRTAIESHSRPNPTRVTVEKASNGGYVAETSKNGEYPSVKSIHKTHMDVANHIKAMCK